MYNEQVEKIFTDIKSRHILFYIQHSDFFAVKKIIEELRIKFSEESDEDLDFPEYNFYKYTYSLGGIEYDNIEPCSDDNDWELESWLAKRYSEGKDEAQFLVLKDVLGNNLSECAISYIKEIVERSLRNRKSYNTVIFIYDSKNEPFPKTLESLITVVEIPPLTDEDIKDRIKHFVETHFETRCSFLNDEKELNDFVYSFKGLQAYQIDQILRKICVNNNGQIVKNQESMILSEKKEIIKKTGTLEIIEHTEDFGNIGGLAVLKKWLNNKKTIYSNISEAKEFGVEIPKGILIAGMPGCGKSLTAKATASLFNVPLIRLDIGSLLGEYIGQSESNMRTALKLAESFSPCVLWIDEMEKAFAGIGNKNKDSGNEVVMRLFGQFLTWIQEKDSSVFIVATANDITSLPPELLRRGRFDELFYVGLPSAKERKDIFSLKLKLKNKMNENIDIEQLAECTNGYSGSDIEDIVNTAIENKFIEMKTKKDVSKDLTTEMLIEIAKSKKSISETMGTKILELEETYGNFKLLKASGEE